MSDVPAQAGQGGFTTRMQRTVEWGDCDPAGIIFYPTYYRWMDAASWHLFAQAGYGAARMRTEHLSLPLVHTECSFLRSPTFGETCIVESCVERLGGKSFTVRHRFLAADGALELASGRETRVWCRYEAGPGTPLRGEALPDGLRALLAGGVSPFATACGSLPPEGGTAGLGRPGAG